MALTPPPARAAGPAAWLAGARVRTLPASTAPVLIGWGAAAELDSFGWWQALLALLVAVALQVGVNYANDYSDGVRGTDNHRTGPLRLVGSGAARPATVRAAAVGCLGVAAVVGLLLVAATGSWWLLLPGIAAVAAAWLYTGGPLPYGYRALGEVAVFVFFGLFAVLGTVYVQAGRVSGTALAGAIGAGALACAILVANNLRDIPGDTTAGKRTLAVVLGDARSRSLYLALLAAGWLAAVVAAWWQPWTLLALGSIPLAVRPARRVRAGATGRQLIGVLRDTGLVELSYAVLFAAGLVCASRT